MIKQGCTLPARGATTRASHQSLTAPFIFFFFLQAMASVGWFLTSFVVIAAVLPVMIVPLSVVATLYFAIYRRFRYVYAPVTWRASPTPPPQEEGECENVFSPIC